jgi:protein-disulfide isomerase
MMPYLIYRSLSMKRLLLAPLLLACSSLTYADKAADLNVSPAERAKIEEVVHQYLIQKPEVLVEALQVLQAKQSQQAERTVKETQKIAAAYADPLFHQENDPIGGNPNGKVTIVEFFDYQCPHCVDMAPIIDSIVKANPDVRVVYKEFPVRGPLSKLAASAALAANQQGKYTAFINILRLVMLY